MFGYQGVLYVDWLGLAGCFLVVFLIVRLVDGFLGLLTGIALHYMNLDECNSYSNICGMGLNRQSAAVEGKSRFQFGKYD